MLSFTELKCRKLQVQSVGVYYLNETTQKIGYYKDGNRIPENFVQVCIIEINCPFQTVILNAIRETI